MAGIMGRFRRWYMGYRALAFVALIPIASYAVIQVGLPKKILLFVIPMYALLAWSFYAGFNRPTRPK
jgi:hypothetical protein